MSRSCAQLLLIYKVILNIMSKKFLITGGAGFIGSAVIRHIIDDDYAVVNVDNLTYAGNLKSLSHIDKDARYSFEKVDICNASESGEY